MNQVAQHPIRSFRNGLKMSLDQFCDRCAKHLPKRPSKAKLSRIETCKQPVPLNMLEALSRVTGLPPEVLRPDVAAKFVKREPTE